MQRMSTSRRRRFTRATSCDVGALFSRFGGIFGRRVRRLSSSVGQAGGRRVQMPPLAGARHPIGQPPSPLESTSLTARLNRNRALVRSPPFALAFRRSSPLPLISSGGGRCGDGKTAAAAMTRAKALQSSSTCVLYDWRRCAKTRRSLSSRKTSTRRRPPLAAAARCDGQRAGYLARSRTQSFPSRRAQVFVAAEVPTVASTANLYGGGVSLAALRRQTSRSLAFARARAGQGNYSSIGGCRVRAHARMLRFEVDNDERTRAIAARVESRIPLSVRASPPRRRRRSLAATLHWPPSRLTDPKNCRPRARARASSATFYIRNEARASPPKITHLLLVVVADAHQAAAAPRARFVLMGKG